MRIVRTDTDRDENKPPSLDDCLAHRCLEHRDIPPIDDSEDSSGAECGVCVGHKFVALLEEKTEEHILNTLLWPAVETARARLNLLAAGTGETFVDEIREHVDEYIRARQESEGAHAQTNTATNTTAGGLEPQPADGTDASDPGAL